MDRLDALVDEKTRNRIMNGCGSNCAEINTRVIEKAKARRKKYKTTEDFLKAEQEKPQRGTVICVGQGKLSEQTGKPLPLPQKVGDIVLYGKYAGTEITIDGEEYLIMRASDILGKVPQ